MENKISISPGMAYFLANQGVWVRSPGYYWRNKGNIGEYRAYGEYPNNVRWCAKFTLNCFTKRDFKWHIIRGVD